MDRFKSKNIWRIRYKIRNNEMEGWNGIIKWQILTLLYDNLFYG